MHTVHGYPHSTLSCLLFTLRHDENGSPSYYSHFPALCSCWTRCLAYGCSRHTRSRTVGSHRQPEQAVFTYAPDRRSVFFFEKTLQSPSGGSTDTSDCIVSLPGGSAFAASYDYDTQLTSSCTTSGLTIDKSNYWMPQSAEPFASETQLQY